MGVHTSLAELADDFVLIDVRSHESFAAAHIAELGRPVEKMIGGLTGWLDEGFALR